MSGFWYVRGMQYITADGIYNYGSITKFTDWKDALGFAFRLSGTPIDYAR